MLWWQQYGEIQYSYAKKLIILCDGGGSNGYRHLVFKETIQKPADRPGITIRVAHYPSSCSKNKPMEPRVFPCVAKALSGIVPDKVETVKELVESRAETKTGLKVFSDIIDKVSLTGKKLQIAS